MFVYTHAKARFKISRSRWGWINTYRCRWKIDYSYHIAQAWSQDLYRHPDRVDGLYYCSRYDPSKLCVALYEHRVERSDLEEQRITAANLLDPSFDSELQQFLDRYGYERDDTEDPSI